MAEKTAHDVVTKVQSVRDPSPTDVSATQPIATSAHVASENPLQASQTPSTATDNAITTNLDQNESSDFGALRAESRGAESEPDKSASSITPLVEGSQSNRHSEGHKTPNPEVAEDGAGRITGTEDNASTEDTEGVLKDLGENQEQARPNALKKSTTFKPVSVTKNFLAQAGTPVAPVAKPAAATNNAAPGTTSQGLARPRLVAKSASGQRASTPKSMGLGSKTDKDSGPDPNQVWNRNRVSAAAPHQATPKHLTDEELRQQYGVSLASRLQEDGDGKEAKWADIDDDEDDWAPDTIEWTDGTKTSLAPVEIPSTPQDDKSTTSSVTGKDIEAEKAKTALAKPPSSVGPNATIFKIGSGSDKKIGGLVSRGSSDKTDKPTLVARPLASTPAKSPWAQLPPVEKVTPVAINPVAPSQPARFGHRDPHGFDAMPPPPLHAKEIAADDFSRQSRDNRNGASNQLFNAHSGQYEPVKEQRRGSIRKDQNNFRTHSVLQRPQPGDSNGPAEPSPAFQTQRTSTGADSSHWTRRRASSSISGESGNADRRQSLGQAPDMSRFSEDPRHRRGSQLERVMASSGLPGVGANRSISPAESRGHPVVEATTKGSRQGSSNDMPMPSPRLVRAPQDGVGNASVPPTPPYQDAAAMTADIKKVMREKGEAALKRRQEEEAKEEAARRARIRIKMEAMGLTDDKMGKKEATPLPQQAPAPEAPSTTEKEVEERTTEAGPIAGPVVVESSKVVEQPPKKVIEPRPVNGITAQVNELVAEVKAETAASALRSFTEKEPATSFDSHKPLINGTLNKRSPLSSQLPSPENRQTYSSKESAQQHWPSTGLPDPGPVTDWSTTGTGSGMTTHSSSTANLWGPPPHQRSLGNGDFHASVERLQPRNQQFQPQHLPPPSPQPIGPPRAQQQTQNQPPVPKNQDEHLRSVFDKSQQINRQQPPNMAATEAFQHQIPRQDARNVADAIKTIKPFAQATAGSTPAGWAQFAATAERKEATQSETLRRERGARAIEDAKKGAAPAELNLSSVNQTWRKVSTGIDADARRLGRTDEVTVNGPISAPIPEDAPRVASRSPNSSANGSNLPIAPPIRSKFFPFGQASSSPIPRVSGQPTVATRFPSPPPPDSDDHPAYVGVKEKPFVNLPKPVPTVRLPPSLAPIKEVPIVVEATATEPKSSPQPNTSIQDWQAKFNGLLGRSTQQPTRQTSEKNFANVESSSKVPFELASLENDAVITLPTLHTPPTLPVQPTERAQHAPPTVSAQPAQPAEHKRPALNTPPTILSKVEQPAARTELIAPASKNVEEEEALFEEDREMGSTPTVRLPDGASSGGWNVAKPKTYRPRAQKLPAEVDSQTVASFFGDEDNRPVVPTITVSLKGMANAKLVQCRGQQNISPRYAHHQHGMRSQQGPNSPNFRGGKPSYRGRSSRESSGSTHVSNTTATQKPAAAKNAIQAGYTQAPVSRPNPSMNWSRVANIAAVGRI